MDIFKDCISSLNDKHIHFLDEHPDAEKHYNSYIVNKNFSFGHDSLLYADLMNQLWFIDKKMQYDFYFYGLEKRKRYNKWIKPETVENLDVVKEYYKCGNKRAKEYLNILTEEQLKIIKQKLSKGGIAK